MRSTIIGGPDSEVSRDSRSTLARSQPSPSRRATARTPVARLSPTTYAAVCGDVAVVTLTGDRGSVTMPVVVTDDLVDDTVWVPTRSTGNGVLADLASPGTGVRAKGARS